MMRVHVSGVIWGMNGGNEMMSSVTTAQFYFSLGLVSFFLLLIMVLACLKSRVAKPKTITIRREYKPN